MSPRGPLLFLLVGLAGWGWDVFGDPARAAFVFEALLCCVALLLLARDADDWPTALVCIAGASIEAAAVACGSFFSSLSQVDGVCDEATGRPVRAAAGLAVLFLAAEILRRAGRGGRR